jgi:hypothetical protein
MILRFSNLALYGIAQLAANMNLPTLPTSSMSRWQYSSTSCVLPRAGSPAGAGFHENSGAL